MFRKRNQDKANEPNQPSEIEQKEEENDTLFNQLTNKNREYMVKLNRQLEENNFPERQKIRTFNEMLKNIVEQQEHHITARRLYGTVTDQAYQLLENPQPDDADRGEPGERSETWKIYMDGALLLGGMFAIIAGLSYVVGTPEAGLGLMTMILNFLLGGLGVLVITKYAPVPGQKGSFLKYILATTLTMIVWVSFMSLGEILIPPVLNPHIPGSITLVIGAIAILAKWYLKKKLNIKGTLF